MNLALLAYRNLNVPRRLASDFLGVFSGAEFALKHAGFARGDKTGAHPDWDAYAKAISPKFSRLKRRDFRKSVVYLLSHPPRKQVVVKGHITWRDSPPPSKLSEAEQVLLLVRRVRNNLFHGGKFLPRDVTPERDRDLVRHSLTVLKACLRLHPHVGVRYGI